MFSINTAKMVTKMPFKDCIYVLICFTIYTLYCISTYLEKSMTMSRYRIVSDGGWWIDAESINRGARCKNKWFRPENVKICVLLGIAPLGYHPWGVVFPFQWISRFCPSLTWISQQGLQMSMWFRYSIWV